MQTLLILTIAYILSSAGLYGVFRKAGQKPVLAFIPFYNYYIWLRIIKSPWWWIFLLIIPSVSFIMFGIMSYQLARCFGKKKLPELLFAVILVPVYLLYLGFSKKQKFTGPPDPSKQKPSAVKEWVDAIIFAVVVATIVRTFFIEAFTIPTSSLEKTLLVGDYLFVSKMSYGAKMPLTPVAFPFAHHTLPLTTGAKSYIEWIKFPHFRLPGFGDVERNDLVVFNYPDGDTVALNYQDRSYYQLIRDEAQFLKEIDMSMNKPLLTEEEYTSAARAWVHTPGNVSRPDLRRREQGYNIHHPPYGRINARPPDKRENYVKRCVAIAGDKLEIKDKVLYINEEKAFYTENMQFNYIVRTGSPVSPALMDKLDITEQYTPIPEEYGGGYVMNLSDKNMQKLKQAITIDTIIPIIDKPGPELIMKGINSEIFPHSPHYPWTKDNFGPLLIPKKGMTVKLDTVNIVLYDRIIRAYERNKLEILRGKIFINGVQTDSYTFKMDYYFMMGDNRHNSADSRYWGYVPNDHVVGKPVFVWMSIKDPEKNPVSGVFRFNTLFSEDGKFRWQRFFTFVNPVGTSRSYLPHFLVISGSIYLFFKLKNRVRKKYKKPKP